MNSTTSRGAVLLLAALSFGACTGTGGPAPANQMSGTIFQVSAFALLQNGHYDGLMPAGAVKRHGNVGLGAADRLDGEMILVDGSFFRFGENGVAQPVPDLMMLPFAAVTFGTLGDNVPLAGAGTYAAVQSAVDGRLPTLNNFYAVRIEGTWDSVQARTYKLQTKRPNGTYPPLDSAAADTFMIRNVGGVQGVMLGFRQPSFASPLSPPNWHLHFIDRGRTRGGHVMNFWAKDGIQVHVSERTFTADVTPLPTSP